MFFNTIIAPNAPLFSKCSPIITRLVGEYLNNTASSTSYVRRRERIIRINPPPIITYANTTVLRSSVCQQMIVALPVVRKLIQFGR